MEVSYEDIRPTFEKLRQYLTYDLNLLKNQEAGGNYVTALLMLVLARLSHDFGMGKP